MAKKLTKLSISNVLGDVNRLLHHPFCAYFDDTSLPGRAGGVCRPACNKVSLNVTHIDAAISTQVRLASHENFVRSSLAGGGMLSALYAIANPSVRLSVCSSVRPSVRHTGGSVENG